MTSRMIFGRTEDSWTRPVFTEGELHVSCGEDLVVARPGDLVRVPAGVEGRYFAPVHARMLAVYDHNPDGAPSTYGGLEQLDPDRG